MNSTERQEILERSEEIVRFLTAKNEEAMQAGVEQHAHFITATAFTLGSVIGYDLKPAGYGPMIGGVLESLTDGLQSAATRKGVKGTFVKIVRD